MNARRGERSHAREPDAAPSRAHAHPAYRRRVQALAERLPRGMTSLRIAACAGLQDSMPRAALLSIHARVDGARPEVEAATLPLPGLKGLIVVRWPD